MTVTKVFTDLNKQFINGEWTNGSSGKSEVILNPYNENAITKVVLADRKDIDAAYEAAQQAQHDWEKTESKKKKEILQKVMSLLHEHKDEIIEQLIQESGGGVAKSAAEINTSLAELQHALDFPEELENYHTVPSIISNKENRWYRKPVGVVAVISPFNFPFYLSMRSVVAAVATGNTVVLKPDFQTGITGGAIVAKLFELAGLPKGVLNMLLCDIEEIGDYFIEHPIPHLISFTGSTAAGRHIAKIAGGNLKKVSLELGGNNPMIILKDVDIDHAVQSAVFGRYLHNGQICISTNRIFVQQEIYDGFVEKFIEKVKTLKHGDPKDPGNLITPMINKRQVEKAMNFIEKGVEEGAVLKLKGERTGNIITPHVFTDVDPDSFIAQHEMFAPIAMITPYDTVEEAIEMANNTEHGLTSSILTEDLEYGFQLADQIDSGMTHVNDMTVNNEPNAPFGGTKHSGIGRFGGHWILDEFTVPKWVSVQKDHLNFGI